MDSNNIKSKATGRSSNIELLRIFAMVMILVYHGFHQLKHAAPDSHLIVYFYTVLGNGVPLFLLISGFFSVNLNAKKIIGFYLYCAIWNMICYVIGLIFVHEPFGLLGCLKQLLPFSHPTVWYPPYYFWLMLFAPLLNTFCRNTDTKQHGLMVVGLYLATVYFGLVWQNEVINNGRSVVYFVYMYLLGAFCRRLYDKDWSFLKSNSQLMFRYLGGVRR